MEVAAVHQVKDKTELLRGLEGVRHAHDEWTALLVKTESIEQSALLVKTDSIEQSGFSDIVYSYGKKFSVIFISGIQCCTFIYKDVLK